MMNGRNRKILSILTIILCTILGGCKNTEVNEAKTENGTIENVTVTVGVDTIDSTFNPIYDYNEPILSSIFAKVCSLDSNGKLMDEAGHVSMEEVTDSNGKSQFLYTVSIQEGMSFSDGEPVTIDDVLAYYYICADPSYDGPSKLKELSIVGLQEYIFDVQNAKDIVEQLEKYQQKNISKEDFINYIIDTKAENWFDGLSMENGGPAGDGSLTWGQYCAMCGVATLEEAVAFIEEEEMLMLLAEAEWTTSADIYDPYSYYVKKLAMDALADGIDVDKISGIERVNDYTCTILLDSFNIFAEMEIANIPIIPKHYYCEEMEKGNLLCVEKKNNSPIGSGQYVLKDYDEDTVFLRANETYFEGSSTVTNREIQLVREEDKIEAVLQGKIQTADMAFSLDSLKLLEQHKEQIAYDVVGETGYGYIGIHAQKVSDVNVRKGLMHLMNRESALKSYYEDYGTIVERPMVPTLAEYPQNASSYYAYDLSQALEYFKLAGFSQINGKLLNTHGEQLKIVAGIVLGNNHPGTNIFLQMAEDMASLGAELVIKELSFEDFIIQLQNDKLEMWTMAWGNVKNCDLSQMFGSNGEVNYYRYSDQEVDEIQKEIIQTKDFDKRCELVSKELDMIMKEAICMPVYQKKRIQLRTLKP